MALPIRRLLPAVLALLAVTAGMAVLFRQGWVGRPRSQITAPEGLYSQAAESPCAQMILDQGGVLLGPEGPVTGAEPVWYFQQRLRNHLDACLEVARFQGETYDAWRFTMEDGQGWVAVAHDMEMEELPDYGDAMAVENLSVNRWGRVMGLLEEEGFCLALVQQRDLVENYDQCLQMTETYLAPISAVLGEQLWQSPRQLTGEMILELFRQLAQPEKDEDWTIPRIHQEVSRYFPDLGEEQLTEALEPWYDPQTQRVSPPQREESLTPQFLVLEWNQGDFSETLELRYISYHPVTGEPGEDSYLLMVELGEGGFSCRSNQYAPYENEMEPEAAFHTFQVGAARNQNRLELFSGEAGGCRLYYGSRQANVPVFLDPEQVRYPLGSFITRPKTALVYGGIPEEGPQPLSILISDDAGEHWISGDLSAAAQKGESFRQRLVGFSSMEDGWLLLGGKTGPGGQKLYGYLTADGGASWKEIPMPEPGGQLLTGAFSDEKHGFLLTSGQGEGPALYRTWNQGRSWKETTLPEEFRQAVRTGSVTGPLTLGKTLILVCQVPGEEEQFVLSRDQGTSWSFPSQGGREILLRLWSGQPVDLNQLG